MKTGTQSTARPDCRHLNDPDLIAQRAAVREQLEYRPAASAPAELRALATILDAEITVRKSVLVVTGSLAPAGWR